MTTPTTEFARLVPGYKQVDAFLGDAEYEDEEEVVYITLDLGGGVDAALIPSSKSYRLIVRPIAVVTGTMVYLPEESPETILATCTQATLLTTMELRLCLQKAQRSNERTKMLGEEK